VHEREPQLETNERSKRQGTSPKRTVVVGLAVLAAVHAYFLWPELQVSRLDLNDNVMHLTLTSRLVQAIERGENPLDFWVSEWTLGYPVPRTYQTLGHFVPAAAYFLLGKQIDVPTLFAWIRFVLLFCLPLSVFASARMLNLGRAQAVAAAALSSLVATNGLYGFEYGSFLWRGSGLYTQLWATHFLFFSIGLTYRAVLFGRQLTGAAIALSLTFLSHFIYGYMGALTACLLVLVPTARVDRATRAVRVAVVGALAFSLCAFVILPMLGDVSWINHSRWEEAWKWDSFGATRVLTWLVRGELLDYGRLPVLSLFALIGLVVAGSRFRKLHPRKSLAVPIETTPADEAHRFLVSGAVFWILMFFGRPTWGVLLSFLGASPDLHLHRLVGGFHLFTILLVGVAFGSLWDLCRRPRSVFVSGALTVILLVSTAPALIERNGFLAKNREWGESNLTAYEAEKETLDAVVERSKDAKGRVYPGLKADWGGEFEVGSVPIYAFLSVEHVPAVAFLHHAMSLTADIMVRFDQWNRDHYRLFNIGTVLAEPTTPLPPFLRPSFHAGRFRLFDAPSNGYFDLVSAPFIQRCSKATFYEVNDRWLHSDWVAKRNHIRLDFGEGRDDSFFELPRLYRSEPLPHVEPVGDLGGISEESRLGETYRASVVVRDHSFLLFKMTYHPKWRAYVDGDVVPTVALSPGFVGVPMSPGNHEVEMRYEPGPEKAILLALGLMLTSIALWSERRGALRRVEELLSSRARSLRAQLLSETRLSKVAVAGGVLVLALPICLPFTSSQLLGGHDSFEYFPRLIEFHENITSGTWLPRWAPDLSSGFGQPLFLFNPPLVYYLGEIGVFFGLDPIRALNLATILLIVGSAVSMYFLGALYFGRAGGVLAAAAYLYAPYFHVNLFVRHALAEFSAFPFYPLALYGFGRFAKERKLPSLLVGSAAFAAVFFCHNVAALVFAPMLLVFVLSTSWHARSIGLLMRQMGGFALGAVASAAIWLPVLVERNLVHVDRLLEGHLRYVNHFVYPQQLLFSPWGYGISVPGYEDGMSFSIGWAHLVLAILVWWWLRERPGRVPFPVFRLFAWLAVPLIVIMLPGSQWVWDRIALLQYVEFPWRLLGPLAVCVSMLVAPLGVWISQRVSNKAVWIAAALAFLVLPNVAHIRPEGLHDVEIAQWQPEEIARRGIAVTTRREYEPRWMSARPPFREALFTVVTGDAEILNPSRTPTRISATVDASRDSRIELRNAFFPGWTAFVNRGVAPIGIAEGTGLIRVQVPRGRNEVVVAFRRTWPRFVGESLSLVSISLMVFLWIRRGGRTWS
jgi:hypothetical protein